MNNDYVISLDKISKDDINIAGGKAANLGEMIKIGIPVPEGFVVTTVSYDMMIQKYDFAERIKKILEDTNVDNTLRLFEASRKIKELILSCDTPSEIEERIKEAYIKLISQSQIELHPNLNKYSPNVAVRSSATAEDLPDALSVSDQ